MKDYNVFVMSRIRRQFTKASSNIDVKMAVRRAQVAYEAEELSVGAIVELAIDFNSQIKAAGAEFKCKSTGDVEWMQQIVQQLQHWTHLGKIRPQRSVVQPESHSVREQGGVSHLPQRPAQEPVIYIFNRL